MTIEKFQLTISDKFSYIGKIRNIDRYTDSNGKYTQITVAYGKNTLTFRNYENNEQVFVCMNDKWYKCK